jgi:ribosomal peptide maturation radical SAM protein 1
MEKTEQQLQVLENGNASPALNRVPLSAVARKGRVLLIDMPFRTVRVGSLGLSTLKSVLKAGGVETDICYLSVKLARDIGTRFYGYIAHLGSVRYSGEIFFTPHYYDLPREQFVQEKLLPYFSRAVRAFSPRDVAGLEWNEQQFLDACADTCMNAVPRLMDEFMNGIQWDQYDIVGFSLIFDQTMPSLMMAKRIKQQYPEKTIIFGGPSCDGGMGMEMLRVFPWIDVVSIGEADTVVLPLVRALREGRPLREVPGIGFRATGNLAQTATPGLLEELDQLPMPEYDNYFDAICGSDIDPQMYFESSRGCWWGQKHLCTFCGLNANGLQYRRKSPERTVKEILYLAGRYGCKSIGATDNILDISFFKTVFPALREWRAARVPEEHLHLFYEMKSNVKKEQLQMARQAGLVWAQPGIESFNDHILQLMDKGATGIQQMQYIKWASEMDISLQYGVLYRNPGETLEDYEDIRRRIDFMSHLHPPTYLSDISIDRFSPYFRDPERHGIRQLRPHANYKEVFLEEDLDLTKMAYRFEFNHEDDENKELWDAIQQCLAALTKWKNTYRPGTLMYDTSGGKVWILDRRGGKPILATLTGPQAEVFLYCDEHHSLENVQEKFSEYAKEFVTALIDKLCERKWLFKDGRNRCLAMPVRGDLSAYTARRAAEASRQDAVGQQVSVGG